MEPSREHSGPGTSARPAYSPKIPSFITNFGLASWRFRTEAGIGRLFAPRFPPWGFWVTVTVASLAGCAIVGVVIWQSRKHGSPTEQAIVIAGSCIAGGLGLLGTWSPLYCQMAESRKGDLLRCDDQLNVVELPRRAIQMAKTDVRRIEMVRFGVRSGTKLNYETSQIRDLVLVRANTDGSEAFELLFRNGAPMKRCGKKIASFLGVPFLEVYAGQFDSQTKQRVD